MASNKSTEGLQPPNSTTPMAISNHQRPRATSGDENVSCRDFSSRPLTETTTRVEPFPSLSPDPLTRPISRQYTNEAQPADRASTIHLTPPRAAGQVLRQRPIGIKRISSYDTRQADSSSRAARKRTSSTPQRPADAGTELSSHAQDGSRLQPSLTASSNLATLTEGVESQLRVPRQPEDELSGTRPARSGSRRVRAVSDAAKSIGTRFSGQSDEHEHPRHDEYEYDHDVVDLLDVLDPEVSTLTTLTNVQNSLFVPDLGRWLNRRPTYELSPGPTRQFQQDFAAAAASRKPLPRTPSNGPVVPPKDKGSPEVMSDIDEEGSLSQRERVGSRLSMTHSIASVVQEEHYAVLPHGVSLEGWTEEEKELLDDYVRHMLHSKRSRFKRSMRAFGKYVRKPLGFFVTLYATLITLFGLAWVLFLIGWISIGARQLYIINVIDNVLVALFAIMGDGLAPFRAVDTYHMIYIAHYHHLSWRLRKKKALPKLQDHNDLPAKPVAEVDVEAAKETGDAEFSVLTPEQQKKLQHHSEKFSKSHSFYKPHETTTHYAFPLRLLITIVVLLDCHSLFQIALGTCTWAISYHTRPPALTTVILCCSITVNIVAGVIIKIGDKKTRKKDVLLRMNRQQLTSMAMRNVERRKEEIQSGDEKLDEELQEEWEKKHQHVIGEQSAPSSKNGSQKDNVRVSRVK